LYHYCLVAGDLLPGQQFAQLLHAAGESASAWSLVQNRALPENTHAIALEAPGEQALLDLALMLDVEGVPYKLIREPDLADRATALGLQPQPREKLRRLLARFPLLRR
jgi:hypothetical protein